MNKLQVAICIALACCGCGERPAPGGGDASAIAIEATQLANEYAKDPKGSNTRYGGKRVRVTGVVRKIASSVASGPAIFLNGEGGADTVQCLIPRESEARLSAFEPGSRVTLTGTVAGTLPDVLLERCE